MKIFNATAVTPHGWIYDNAVCMLDEITSVGHKTWKVDWKTGKVDITESVGAKACYCVSFWDTQKRKQQGVMPFAIVNPDADDDEKYVFEIDIEQYQSQYDSFNGDQYAKLAYICELDYKTVQVRKLTNASQ